MILMTGCTVGVKQSNTLLFVSPVPIPQVAHGAPMIATDKKVDLAIIGKPDMLFSEKITGYVVVDPWFYEKLIQAWNKSLKKSP